MVDKYIPNIQLRLRRRYRPTFVRVLVVGESPPASGRFFYKGDSGLYRAFREAFQVVDPAISDANFLRAFQGAGCYLVDLCDSPVDQLSPALRRNACVEGESALSQILKELQPETIVCVVHSIRSNVDRAVVSAGWQGQRLNLPYPGRWQRHRQIFIAQFVPLLRSLSDRPAA